MSATLACCALLLLLVNCVALPVDEPYIDLTSYYSLSASSVCGDAPTQFEIPKNSGQLQNCNGSEYLVENAVDGNSSTRWQSASGDTPVEIYFTLSQPALSLSWEGIRMTTDQGLPRYLFLEERRAGEQSFTTLRAYVLNATADCAGMGDICEEYTIEEFLSDGAVILLCPETFSEPVSEVRIRLDRFQERFENETSQYYVVSEVQLLGWIAEGYFARSLTAISVEGEMGFEPGALSTPAPNSTDEGLIAGFSSRGFASFSVDISSQVLVKWVFPSIPATTSYQIWLRYTNPGPDAARGAMVLGELDSSNARVVFRNCPPPNACHTPLVMSDDITTIASFTLISGPTTSLTVTLSNIDLYLDVIIAVPMAFYDATILEESDRFLQSCDFIGGSLGQGTADEQFCQENAVELSLHFYQSTYMCGCSAVGASGEECDVYGGQCDCIDQLDGVSRITGRRCDMCPFLTYLTTSGCADCGCPGATQECRSTGQCLCPPLVTGRTCDSCVVSSFGDPLEGCSVCTCDSVGTEYCNDTTGECICKLGVAGESCDECEVGRFNLSSLGCEECGCDSVGSVSSACDDSGQCACQPNVGDLKCSSCLPGFYFFSSAGCTACNCSGRTNDCSQNPNVTSEPLKVCNCPAPYVGESCDQCDTGWFLSAATGDCEMCQCNGLADVCLDGNGACLGCRGNSTGEGCNVCIDDYYDADPAGPSLVCLPCPCTLVTALDISCTADALGSPMCNCRSGHEGQTCDSCSEGYFGEPPEFRCTQCDCNGNIDPTDPGSCDMATGQCLKCTNNSTGDECETCASGFFGNATRQDCQMCDCNASGSTGSLCDSTTGQCSCLPGVNGLRCEQCLPNYWNFTASVGCQPCMCQGSIVSDVCDGVTGLCECRDGVGGEDCSYCLPGYFNFSTDGCTSCGCSESAVNSSCSADGQCYCQPGVGGAKCDLCEPFNFNLTSSGCEPCGGCEWSLRDDLKTEDGRLRSVAEQVDLLMQLSDTDMQGLGEVGRVTQEVGEDEERTGDTLEEIQRQIDQVNSSYTTTQETVANVDERVSNVSTLTSDLQPVAEEVSDYIQDIYNEIQQGLVKLVDSTAYAEAVQPVVAQQAGLAEEIVANVTSVAELHRGNFSDVVQAIEAELTQARETAVNITHARNFSRDLNREAGNLIGQYQDAAEVVEGLLSSVEELNNTLERAKESLENTESIAAGLRVDVEVINDVISESQTEVERARLVIVDVEANMPGICEEVDDLKRRIGNETPAVSGSGTESDVEMLEPEPENGIVPAESGSGIELAPATIAEQVGYLCEGVDGVRVGVGECEGVVMTAEAHADDLEQEAALINSILSASLAAGGEAVEAILNFTSSIEAIEEAINITTETSEMLEQVLVEVGRVGMGSGDLDREVATELLATSQTLLREAEDEAARADSLIPEVMAAQGTVQEAERQTALAGGTVQQLQHHVQSLSTATETTISQSSLDINSIESSFNITSTTHTSLLTTLPSNAISILATVNDTQENFDLAQSVLNSANTTIRDAERELEERRRYLEQAEETRANNSAALESLASDLEGLRAELERARRAAALIDVALRFYGNSSLGYDTILSPTDSATRISLVFNPSETTGLMLYSSAGGEGQHSLSLQLDSGSIGFSTEVGGAEGVETVATATGVIQEDTWYQLFATREDLTSQLSVSPLHRAATYTASLSSPSPPSLPLPPNGTLYLGGSPSALTPLPPSLVATGYSGCLDRVVINNSPVSLLLPDQVEGETLQLCGPRPPSEAPRQFETGAWLRGGGSYIQVVTTLITGTSPLSIQLSFRTFAVDGLLVTLYSEDMAQRLAVVVAEGRLRLQFSRDLITMATANTVGVVNDGEWHTVEVEVDGVTAFLSVDSNERVNASAVISTALFEASSKQFYIGGVPSNVLASIGSSELSLAGCVRNLRVGGVAVALHSTLNSSRVSFNGCPSEVAPGVRFSGDGMAVLSPSSEEVYRVSFAFHSSQLAALLLSIGSEPDSIEVGLYHTRLRVDGPGVILESIQDGLNDDAWHYVVLVLGNDNMNLTVDEETVTTPTSGPLPPAGSRISVGGVTPPTSAAVTENFRGCVDQLAINDMPIDFSQSLSLDGVSLYGCSPESVTITTPLPPPPPPPLPPPPSTNPNISVGLDGQEGSFLAIPLDREELVDRHIIILQFQTSSPNAMLLYTQGNFDFLALELIRGVLYYTYNLGSGRVILASVGTYNDGLEHSVELYRGGRNGTMVIDDGAEVVSNVSPGSFTSLNIDTEMLFVGGTPLALPPSNLIRFRTTGEEIPPSTLGCVLSLSVNGVYTNFSSPQASSGTEDCRGFYTNVATFHGTGYLLLLDEVEGGVDFSVAFDFQTTSCTGLLLYTASFIHPDHLALELVDGVVRFIFDNGPATTVVEYFSTNSLCDGQWHSVSLVKNGITGVLSVDGMDPITADSDVASFFSLDLGSPLFVGGVPDTQALRSTVVSSQVGSSSYSGCIRNVYVSTTRTGPLERDLAQATQSTGVTFHTCSP